MSELILNPHIGNQGEKGEGYKNAVLPVTPYVDGEKAAQAYLGDVQVYGIKGALERLAAGQTGKTGEVKPEVIVVFER